MGASLGLAALAASLAVPTAASATIVVQNTNDMGTGSLRAAIAAAAPRETVQLPAWR